MLFNSTVTAVINAASKRPLSPVEQDVLARSIAEDSAGLAKASEHWQLLQENMKRAQRYELPSDLPQLVVGPRQHGKTHAVAQWIKDGRQYQDDGTFTNDRAVITAGPDIVRRVLIADYDLHKDEVITAHKAKTGGRLNPALKYAVDSADIGRIIAESLGQKHRPACLVIETPYEWEVIENGIEFASSEADPS